MREIIGSLPPGFAGDVVDSPKCPEATFDEEENRLSGVTSCPIGTQVGIETLTLISHQNGKGEVRRTTAPVWNLDPNPGEVAKLGFLVGDVLSVQGTLCAAA